MLSLAFKANHLDSNMTRIPPIACLKPNTRVSGRGWLSAPIHCMIKFCFIFDVRPAANKVQ
jgi:hypothetical protein